MNNEDNNNFKKHSDVNVDDLIGKCWCLLCKTEGYVYEQNGENKTTMICQNTEHRDYWKQIKFNKMDNI